MITKGPQPNGCGPSLMLFFCLLCHCEGQEVIRVIIAVFLIHHNADQVAVALHAHLVRVNAHADPLERSTLSASAALAACISVPCGMRSRMTECACEVIMDSDARPAVSPHPPRRDTIPGTRLVPSAPMPSYSTVWLTMPRTVCHHRPFPSTKQALRPASGQWAPPAARSHPDRA